ncbi:hypothetical protein CFIICLFH_1371 [Methylobacterium goesingense]|nr:hypothetical protein CFIICLFH_1371 [Methylobacterium goesingense]
MPRTCGCDRPAAGWRAKHALRESDKRKRPSGCPGGLCRLALAPGRYCGAGAGCAGVAGMVGGFAGTAGGVALAVSVDLVSSG